MASQSRRRQPDLHHCKKNLKFDDYVNLLGENVNTTKKGMESLLDASGHVGLELHAEKTNDIYTSCHHNPGKTHNLMTANKSITNVAELKYLGMIVTNQIVFMKKLRAD
jgi:hypothetical protein